MKILVAPLVICLFLSVGTAQRITRKPPPKAQQPSGQTTPTPVAPAQPTVSKPNPARAPVAIVVINGRTITSAEFEPDLRQEIESADPDIAETKRSLLDLQINTLLLQAEARKRGITTERLYDLEVRSKVTQPTTAEIKKFFDEHQDQFDGMESSAVASRIASYLVSEREGKVADQLVERLKKLHQVSPGVDINSSNLNDNSVVATVAGQPVLASTLNERLKPIVYRRRVSAYEAATKKANQMITDILLLNEANRRQIGPEQIIRAEVTEKTHAPTDAEITKFYEENKARINTDLEKVRFQISSYLQERDRERLENELSARLRKGADIRWLIREPVQPVQAVSVDDDPARGEVNAPVTIVEFTDFQCPSCAAMHPVLEEVLKSYSAKVRLVVRDYPLAQHENALKAAEAANAANAQGKFFEYTALLYTHQKALDVASLKKYASEIGLNRQKFDAALDSGTYAAEVKHDIEDAEIYGVNSTPTIFVNGVMLRVISAQGLRDAIDKAAAARK